MLSHVKCLKDADLLLKGISKIIENEAKEQKEGFFGMLLGALGASLLGNLLTGKWVEQANVPKRGVMRSVEDTIRAGEGTIRAGRIFFFCLTL